MGKTKNKNKKKGTSATAPPTSQNDNKQSGNTSVKGINAARNAPPIVNTPASTSSTGDNNNLFPSLYVQYGSPNAAANVKTENQTKANVFDMVVPGMIVPASCLPRASRHGHHHHHHHNNNNITDGNNINNNGNDDDCIYSNTASPTSLSIMMPVPHAASAVRVEGLFRDNPPLLRTSTGSNANSRTGNTASSHENATTSSAASTLNSSSKSRAARAPHLPELWSELNQFLNLPLSSHRVLAEPLASIIGEQDWHDIVTDPKGIIKIKSMSELKQLHYEHVESAGADISWINDAWARVLYPDDEFFAARIQIKAKIQEHDNYKKYCKEHSMKERASKFVFQWLQMSDEQKQALVSNATSCFTLDKTINGKVDAFFKPIFAKSVPLLQPFTSFCHVSRPPSGIRGRLEVITALRDYLNSNTTKIFSLFVTRGHGTSSLLDMIGRSYGLMAPLVAKYDVYIINVTCGHRFPPLDPPSPSDLTPKTVLDFAKREISRRLWAAFVAQRRCMGLAQDLAPVSALMSISSDPNKVLDCISSWLPKPDSTSEKFFVLAFDDFFELEFAITGSPDYQLAANPPAPDQIRLWISAAVTSLAGQFRRVIVAGDANHRVISFFDSSPPRPYQWQLSSKEINTFHLVPMFQSMDVRESLPMKSAFFHLMYYFPTTAPSSSSSSSLSSSSSPLPQWARDFCSSPVAIFEAARHSPGLVGNILSVMRRAVQNECCDFFWEKLENLQVIADLTAEPTPRRNPPLDADRSPLDAMRAVLLWKSVACCIDTKESDVLEQFYSSCLTPSILHRVVSPVKSASNNSSPHNVAVIPFYLAFAMIYHRKSDFLAPDGGLLKELCVFLGQLGQYGQFLARLDPDNDAQSVEAESRELILSRFARPPMKGNGGTHNSDDKNSANKNNANTNNANKNSANKNSANTNNANKNNAKKNNATNNNNSNSNKTNNGNGNTKNNNQSANNNNYYSRRKAISDCHGAFMEDAVARGILFQYCLRTNFVFESSLAVPAAASAPGAVSASQTKTNCLSGVPKFCSVDSFLEGAMRVLRVRKQAADGSPCPVPVLDFSTLDVDAETGRPRPPQLVYFDSDAAPYPVMTTKPRLILPHFLPDLAKKKIWSSTVLQPHRVAIRAGPESSGYEGNKISDIIFWGLIAGGQDQYVEFWIDTKTSPKSPFVSPQSKSSASGGIAELQGCRTDLYSWEEQPSRASTNGNSFLGNVRSAIASRSSISDLAPIKHIVHVIVTPFVPSVPCAAADSVCKSFWGNTSLHSYTLLLVHPSSVAYANLVSQPIRDSLPFAQAKDKKNWFTYPPHSKSDWRHYRATRRCAGTSPNALNQNVDDTFKDFIKEEIKTQEDFQAWLRLCFDDDAATAIGHMEIFNKSAATAAGAHATGSGGGDSVASSSSSSLLQLHDVPFGSWLDLLGLRQFRAVNRSKSNNNNNNALSIPFTDRYAFTRAACTGSAGGATEQQQQQQQDPTLTGSSSTGTSSVEKQQENTVELVPGDIVRALNDRVLIGHVLSNPERTGDHYVPAERAEKSITKTKEHPADAFWGCCFRACTNDLETDVELLRRVMNLWMMPAVCWREDANGPKKAQYQQQRKEIDTLFNDLKLPTKTVDPSHPSVRHIFGNLMDAFVKKVTEVNKETECHILFTQNWKRPKQ